MASGAAFHGRHRLAQYKLDECPDYESVVTSNSDATGMSGHWHTAFNETSSQSSDPQIPRERYLYTYSLVAGTTTLQFHITVEPISGRPEPGKYNFRLSLKTQGIERFVGEPVIQRLHVDPRLLEFVVFVLPGKSSIPPGSLWAVRVWLRVNGIDLRLFGEDDLWVGKDLDFGTVSEASFARLKTVDARSQLYHGFVGRALLVFTVRWQRAFENMYKYTLSYDANGVGGDLFDDIHLRVDGDPSSVTFLIYTVPIQSAPIGASHRIRVWLKSLATPPDEPATAYSLPFNDSYVYQRIWKSDTLKIGARLNFESMGHKAIMGVSSRGPQTIVTTGLPHDLGQKHSASASQASDRLTRSSRLS